jgi:hypothetical protein
MHLTESNKKPLARSGGVLTQRVGEEAVVYDLDTKEVHCLKPLAAFVFEASDGSATIGELATRARAEVDRGVTDEQLADAVAQLEQIRLLDAPAVVVIDGDGGVSRREMMRRMGYAGAAATVGTGLVMSIAAPTALAQCSGQPGGCNCTQNKNCLTNHCCQAVAHKCNAGCCTTSNNGTECNCNPNGTCNSPGTPAEGQCCMGTCTPTTTCTPTGSSASNFSQQSTTNGGSLTRGTSAGGSGGGSLTTPSTPAGGTATTPSTSGGAATTPSTSGGTATTPSISGGGSVTTP